MAKDDRIRTTALMSAHIKGIQVDILKYPDWYTPPNLSPISKGAPGKTCVVTHSPPTILPAIKASSPPMMAKTSGVIQMTFQLRRCTKQAQKATTKCMAP